MFPATSCRRQDFTGPLNLLTLARHQPLYISLRFVQGPVFLLNSRLRHFSCALTSLRCQGSLIPKLRLLFCRVPKRGFSRPPEHTYAHPPVSVYGTVSLLLTLEVFPGSLDLRILLAEFHSEKILCLPDLPSRPIFSLDANSQMALEIRGSVTPSESKEGPEY